MAEFLSKEEIKQWRSSLEKITLEEFAARLGKVVAESRPTNDLVDIVMSGNSSSSTDSNNIKRADKLSGIAERAFERERQLSHTPFSFKAPIANLESEKKIEKKQESKKAVSSNEIVDKIVQRQEKEKKSSSEKTLREEVNIVLKKNLTDREQVVFDYFLNHKNTTVYAKDLAALLDLPRDYIYKYIKNLRSKIEGDKLKNADRGGFVLSD